MQSKKLTLFKKYAILLTTSVFSGVMLLSWFQTVYFMNAPERYLPGLKITMSITAGLTFFIALAVFFLTRPFQRIISRFEATGKALSEEEKMIVLNTFGKIKTASIIGCIIGFILGNSITVLVKYILGKYDGTIYNVVVAIMQAIIYAAFVAVFIVYVTDYFFAYYRKMLHIHDTSNIKKGRNVAQTIRFSVIISLLFIISNILMIAFPYFPKELRISPINYLRSIIYAMILNLAPTLAILMLMLKTLTMRIAISEKQIKDLADGKASELIDITNFDDFGELTSSTNKLIEQQLLLVHRIQKEIQSLAVTAKETAATSQDQNAAVKEIVATMEDTNNLSENISEKIQDVSTLAQSTTNDVAKGAVSLQSNVKKLQEIYEANQETIEGIKSLSAGIANVWDIVAMITSVADTAKIIAFNAELEAANAGEAGKNFHIVASEIRRLADGIIDNTKEIKTRITDIQDSSDKLILASESGTTKINEGVSTAKELEANFNSISKAAETTASSAAEITTIIQQQTAASGQILVTLKQISNGAENFSSATESTSSAAENLKTILNNINGQETSNE